MPMNSTMRMTPSQTSTVRALRDSGGSKAGTPSDTASTPVSAVQPEAKARRMRKSDSCLHAFRRHLAGRGGTAISQPNAQRVKP